MISNTPHTTRKLVVYDDLISAQPSNTSYLEVSSRSKPAKDRPPVKKRRRDHPSHDRSSHSVQHWDDPGCNGQQVCYDDDDGQDTSAMPKDGADDTGDEDESRDLTYEEIWDDSALIDAWDAANEEYEALHGKGKIWKKELSKKSPLWYNVPPEKVTRQGISREQIVVADGRTDILQNSNSHNSAVSLPEHDLSVPALPHPPPVTGPDISHYYSQMLPQLTGTNVTADEAFSRALGAMYWGGYWTAMYHAQRRVETSIDEDVFDESTHENIPQDETLVETQR